MFGASPLLPTSATTFSYPNSPIQGDFVIGPLGRVTGFRLWSAGARDTASFERAVEWTPDPAELAEFVGTYRSDEVFATWVVELRDDRLLLTLGRPGMYAPLVPAYRDVFTGVIPMVAFRRDETGRTTGLTVNDQLTRGVVFVRQ